MSTKIAKGKPRQEKPRLKVMHLIKKDENGNATITSRSVPKLKEAIGPDVQQAAEETGHKVPKAKPTKTEKSKDEMTDEQRSVLKALETLGGKDVHSCEERRQAYGSKGSLHWFSGSLESSSPSFPTVKSNILLNINRDRNLLYIGV